MPPVRTRLVPGHIPGDECDEADDGHRSRYEAAPPSVHRLNATVLITSLVSNDSSRGPAEVRAGQPPRHCREPKAVGADSQMATFGWTVSE